MKKLTLLLLLAISIFTLSACDNEKTCPTGQELNEKNVCVDTEVTPDIFTVTFNTNGGTAVAAQEVEDGSTATLPTAPTKEGYTFVMWYTTDDTIEFTFTTAITADITINAYWEEVNTELTDEEKLQADLQNLTDTLMINPNLINTLSRGKLYRTSISWESDSIYISNDGVVLPLPKGEADTTGVIVATLTYKDVEVEHTFNIPLTAEDDVVLATTRNIEFENLTTEYEIEDGTVDLMFEDGGEVPYIKLTDFFDLLDGFIDPATVFTVDTTDGVLTIEYQYIDEDDDNEVYDLILTVDSVENTFGVNDPGFFWAYIYSTSTNYGRHIEYFDETHPGYDFVEGDPILYDLDAYNMDVVLHNDEVYVPYYIANQLFAGSSYYNVYYNYDKLVGIYYVPSDGSDEMDAIRTSSKNKEDMPVDLVIHTFNMLAFDLDYMYGLKDIKNIQTYYSMLYSNRNSFLSTDIADFEDGLFNLIYKKLDDPHTNYSYSSYFNTKFDGGPQLTSVDQLGTRYRNMYENNGYFAIQDALEAKWGLDEDENYLRPDYWFLDEESVVVTLDGFMTVDMDVSYTYDKTMVEYVLEITDADTVLPTVTEGSKFWYYKSSTQDELILELLVKDVDDTYVATYEAALVTLGATKVLETTDEEGKAAGYYSITTGGIDYMIQVAYDDEYEIFYVAVVDELPVLYTDEWVLEANPSAAVNSDSAVYMELVLEQVMIEQPLTENILLDLSYNGGGNIGALYRVMGFITDDPIQKSSIDRDTNGFSTSYFTIDDGVPSYAHLNWDLLVTQATYSAANEMVALFITNDLGEIIGMQTGGGACSVTPVLLPSGTAFTMSSNSIGATRTGAGSTEDPYVYHDTEFGFAPDYLVQLRDIYKTETLLAIINPTVE